jgi:hypothetical protein
MTLKELETALKDLAKSGNPDAWPRALALVVSHLAGTFKITEVDVAILVRTSDGQRLKFEHPAMLAKGVNVFPVSTSSMAGEVARNSRGMVDNAFAATKHLGFYERIYDKKPTTIQKMMAAPLRKDRASYGVVEVSRKGENAADAGPDFTGLDLVSLNAICDAAAPYLALLRPKIP